jgi:hypothetical protein
MKRVRIHVMVAVAMGLAGSLAGVAAGKPPKPGPVAATVTFRCFAEDLGTPGPCDSFDLGGTDRVRDDRAGSYIGSIGPEGMFGQRIATSPNGRLVNMHFGTSIPGTRTCTSVDNCHPNGPTDSMNLELRDFDFRVKPLVDGTWEDLPGLLFGMSVCGRRYPALVHSTFWLPDANGHWGFNFNPRAYPGTTAAVVVRVDQMTWTVEAESDDIGELLSWAHTGIRRHNGPSREGRFQMPFRATIVASGLPAGAGTCN